MSGTKGSTEANSVVRIKRKRAVIFGAGVAGLTAAHELAERGFKVFVIESEEDPRHPFRPLIGGMAATQWSRLPFTNRIGSARDWPNDGRMFPALEQAFLQDLHPSQVRLPRAQASPWPELFFACGSADVSEKPSRCTGLPASQPDPPDPPMDIPSPEARLEGIAAKLAGYLIEVRGLIQGGAFGVKPLSLKERPFESIYLNGTISPSEAKGRGFADERGLIGEPVEIDPLSTARSKNVSDKLVALLKTKLGIGWTITPLSGGREGDLEIATGIKVEGASGTETWRISELILCDFGNVHDGDRTRHEWQKRYVQVAMQSRLVPGEHGYRLFPRFYRHLLDTLRRTPLLDARPQSNIDLAKVRVKDNYRWSDDKEFQPTGRSVFDNLIPVTEQDFACSGNEKPHELPRFRGEGVSDLLDFLRLLQQDMGWDLADVQLAQLRFLQYATSCTQRRETLEDKSWLSYLEGEGPHQVRFSQSFRDSMGRWPQALIGLRAEDIDARTFGSTALQQFIDQLQPFGYRDGTLNGPTTTAWLDHWQRYLESLGVEFYLGSLTKLMPTADGEKVDFDIKWPRFDEVVPEGDNKLAAALNGRVGSVPEPPVDSRGGAGSVPEPPATEIPYVVLALPVEKTWEILKSLPESFPKIPDVEAILKQLDASGPSEKFESSWLESESPKGPLAHFAGIQFFLDEDYRFLDGHVYYPESEWGLTSISQSQFRSDQAAMRFRYRGLVSVVIGNWEKEGNLYGNTAWECSDEELAKECWQQMVDGLGPCRPRMPRWFHLDRKIRQPDPSVRARKNASPYLTLEPGRFRDWPGEPGAYKVHQGNLVFAGTYMKTHTRLVTMESANESGRHAANAILDHWSQRMGESEFAGAEIWTLEDQEPKDLQFLKRIDEKLHAEGLPHAFDILGLGKIIDASAGDTGGHPSSLVEALARVAASQGRGLTAVVEGLRRLVGAVPNPWW